MTIAGVVTTDAARANGVRPDAAIAPGRMLVVDDVEANRELLARRLRRMGHDVEVAVDGLDALAKLAQREPDLEVSVPLLRKQGRMILMAGRTARPTLPLGSFYTRDCSLLGFAMFNASPEEQRRCAEDIVAWVGAGKLKPNVGRVFPLAEAAAAQQFLEENTVGGAGTLRGKVVIQVEETEAVR